MDVLAFISGSFLLVVSFWGIIHSVMKAPTEAKKKGIWGIIWILLAIVVLSFMLYSLSFGRGAPLKDSGGTSLINNETYLVQWSVKKGSDKWIVGLVDRNGKETMYLFDAVPPHIFIRQSTLADDKPIYKEWCPASDTNR